MALNKEKLTDVSLGGFSVEELETLDRQLRETLSAIHAKKWRVASATAYAMEARLKDLSARLHRRSEREEEKLAASAK